MSDLKDFVIKNGVLKKYVGTDSEVIVPGTVTQIAPDAFKDNADIVTVILSEGIHAIGAGAFCGCTSLAKIDIPEGVTRIGHNAFEGCSSLLSVTIPFGVKKIENGLFRNCTSLTSVILPEGITAIGEHEFRFNFEGAFEYCESLKQVNLPESLRLIGANSFRFCTSLESVFIPKKVRTIGYNAFVCAGMRTIGFPEKVVCAKTTVFGGCDNVECIVAETKEAYNIIWKMLEKESQMKILRKAISENTTDPNIVTKIKANSKALLEEAIKEDDEAVVGFIFSLYKKVSVEDLDVYISQASGAPKTQALFLEYKAKRYPIDALEKKESLKVEKELGIKERTIADWKKIFDFEKREGGIVITDYKDTILDVVIPSKIGDDPVVAIGDWCFSARKNPYKQTASKKLEVCKNIETVTLPETITAIGYRAFYKCEKLKAINNLHQSVKVCCGAFGGCNNMADENGFIIVNGVLFGYCGVENDVKISESVVEIDELAFSCQQKLASVIVPDSVISIGQGAFNGCWALASVKLSEKLREIPRDLFKCCRKLQSITLPPSITEIGREAFSDCKALTSIVIPPSVTKIGSFAFSNCKTLTNITILSPATEIGKNSFASEVLTIHAPAGSYAEQYAKENNIPFVAE